MNKQVQLHINKCAKGNHNVFTILKSIQEQFYLSRGEATGYTGYIETKLQQKRNRESEKPYYSGRNIRFQH